MVIFSVRFLVAEPTRSVTVTVATKRLWALRAFLMALRVFLVNFTLTVLALLGWRESETFLPFARSARAAWPALRCFFALSCLTSVPRLTLQAWFERSLRIRT